MFGSVVEAIAYYGQHQGDKIAVVTDSTQINYEELWNKIQQYAAILSKQGVYCGDKIILAVDYTDRFVAAYFAIHWLGAVSIVVEKNASLSSISHLVQSLSPRVIILNQAEEGIKTYEMFDVVTRGIERGKVTPDSLADILFTTGTTGTPKGVMLSHQNEVAGALNVISGGRMVQEDRNLLTMPLHHAFGLTTLRAVLYKGSTAILQDGVASLKKMNDNIQKKRCNCVYMVPSALRVLYFQTRQRLDLLLGTVEKIEFCTAPLDKKMRQVLSEQLKDVRLYNSYGATESARTVYMRLDQNTEKINAIGKAVENVSICIVDDERKVINSSKQNFGHLAIRGDMNMIGYYDDPLTTKQVLENGIFYSEDLGYMDEDGYLYLVGRNNDVINTGGEKVSPLEIENAALEYDGVQECACIGVRDPKDVLEYVPILFIVKESDKNFSTSMLLQHLGKCLENYKVPYKVIEVEEIPKNHVGKIDRQSLKNSWENKNERVNLWMEHI